MSRINDIWLRKPAGLVLGLDFSGGRVSSPTGHVGTLVGNAAVASGTRYLALDGTGDYLQFSDAPEFSFAGGSPDRPFSVGLWAYMVDASGFRIFTKTSSVLVAEWGLSTTGADKLALAIYAGGSAAVNIVQSSNAAMTGYENQWVHFFGTYDGSGTSAGLKLFVNSAAEAATATSAGVYVGMSNTAAPLNVGVVFPSAGSAYANGRAADVRLYNRALTQPEIAQIYNAGAARIALGGTP